METKSPVCSKWTKSWSSSFKKDGWCSNFTLFLFSFTNKQKSLPHAPSCDNLLRSIKDWKLSQSCSVKEEICWRFALENCHPYLLHLYCSRRHMILLSSFWRRLLVRRKHSEAKIIYSKYYKHRLSILAVTILYSFFSLFDLKK